MKKYINIILLSLVILFTLSILTLSVKGIKGNPNETELNSSEWMANGPFELSPERGRFALAYTIAEKKNFFFSEEIAKFSSPDVATANNKYVSLFAPLVSFIVLPGYFVGKIMGISQVGTFYIISLFAVLNFILLRLIAIRMGARKIPATIASLVFLFGTPAFAYATTLYQHHISTFLILLSLYVLLKSEKIWGLFLVFFLCALSIPLDYPNLFLMAPIGFYALGKIFIINNKDNKINIDFKFIRIITIFAVVVPLVFFLWFNKQSYDNPLQLSGTVASAKLENKDLNNIANQKIEHPEKKKSAFGFFQTRDMLNGFYIHTVSPDRGVIYYAPVVIFGILGMILAYRKKVKMTSVLIGIFGANIVLYSMWGDPWGGWAFGSRYLIPSYAVLSIFIGLLLTYWNKKIIFMLVFAAIAFYSVAINTLGAITTSAIPPKIQVLVLEKLTGTVQKYNYYRNWDLLTADHTKSFIFETFLDKYLTALNYYYILTLSICFVLGLLIFVHIFISRKENKNV